MRSGIRRFLEDETGVAVVGEARNGTEALELIGAHRPDVVFLDVQMPGLDGFAVLASLSPADRPAVVFVTAFDEYAIRAFEVHAVDYLLKPFDAERFRLALARVRSRRNEPVVDQIGRLEALLAEIRTPKRFADRLLLKHDGSVIVVLADDIDWIEAADNYVKVHARTGRYMVRESIKSLESQLDPGRFARAHRSAIVNLQRVRSLEPTASGENVIALDTGVRIVLSRGYRDEFRKRLQGRV